jgi:hypothetical protein
MMQDREGKTKFDSACGHHRDKTSDVAAVPVVLELPPIKQHRSRASTLLNDTRHTPHIDRSGDCINNYKLNLL